jgi:hypothetical protein
MKVIKSVCISAALKSRGIFAIGGSWPMAKLAQNFSAAEMHTDFRRFNRPFNAIEMLCFFIADSGVDSYTFFLRFHAP